MDSILSRIESEQRKNNEKSGLEARKMSEKLTLNLMTLALAIGIILTWITWDPQVVICCMVLSVLRLGALFYEYPELQIWKNEWQGLGRNVTCGRESSFGSSGIHAGCIAGRSAWDVLTMRFARTTEEDSIIAINGLEVDYVLFMFKNQQYLTYYTVWTSYSHTKWKSILF